MLLTPAPPEVPLRQIEEAVRSVRHGS